MPEFQASLADRGVVYDRQESHRVGRQHFVEERLIGVEQPDEIDVPFQVRWLRRQLLYDPLDLRFLAIDTRGQEPGQAQHLPLGLRESRGLIELRVVEQVDPVLRDSEHCVCHEKSPFEETGRVVRISSHVPPIGRDGIEHIFDLARECHLGHRQGKPLGLLDGGLRRHRQDVRVGRHVHEDRPL